jgi:glycosyltransferase involved in cell wall biosynthesis
MSASSATGPRGAIAGTGKEQPRRIAVVPAYNEEPMVVAVLDKLYPLVDELVVVDDGSTDGTRSAIEAWLPGHDHCHLLKHDVNQGMSEAYLLALTTLRARMDAGELSPDDLVFTVDADGQHDIAVLNELVEITMNEHIDAMLARRDMSYHGAYKRFGNFVLSAWASMWAAQRLYDVESGYRVFRLGALAHALDFYSGHKYSETVEVAVVMSRLGKRVRNDHIVPVPVARSRTSLTDAAKCVLISFDSTMRSNLSVAMPLDLICYERDTLAIRMRRRFEQGDPYFASLSREWSEGVRAVFRQLPEPPWSA